MSAAVESFINDESRWSHIKPFLANPGPYTDQYFRGEESFKVLNNDLKILVIGAGGLGCEILQNLALLGFSTIHVIDMDTIDISNLNRQFLFRQKDVGRPKAVVAAEFVMKRVPGVNVVPYYGKIQDKDDQYYMQFNFVICGLDSIEARRWINAKLVSLVDFNNNESIKPLIDGGTEGFQGQSRVIIPQISSCYECGMDLITPQTTFPICTIADTPRLPEHCIEWASTLEWPKQFPGKKIDTDNPDDIQWLYETALKRAKQFEIEGITWSLTQGVVKNVIPAIASTNAIIAASCCNEAFKIATNASPYLENYMMYSGTNAVYTYTFELGKKPDCPVCGEQGAVEQVQRSRKETLQDLVDWLKENPTYQLKKPSLTFGDNNLFLQNPPQLREATAPNLEKTLGELLSSPGEESVDQAAKGFDIDVTDSALPLSLTLRVTFED